MITEFGVLTLVLIGFYVNWFDWNDGERANQQERSPRSFQQFQIRTELRDVRITVCGRQPN